MTVLFYCIRSLISFINLKSYLACTVTSLLLTNLALLLIWLVWSIRRFLLPLQRFRWVTSNLILWLMMSTLGFHFCLKVFDSITFYSFLYNRIISPIINILSIITIKIYDFINNFITAISNISASINRSIHRLINSFFKEDYWLQKKYLLNLWLNNHFKYNCKKLLILIL